MRIVRRLFPNRLLNVSRSNRVARKGGKAEKVRKSLADPMPRRTGSRSVLRGQKGNWCVLIRFARRYRHRATGERGDTVVTVADDAEF